MRERTITVTLTVDDPLDLDPTHSMGITTEAYENLMDALSSTGFSIKSVERDY